MKRTNYLILLLFIALAVSGCSRKQDKEKSKKVIPVKNIKLISLKVLTGKEEGRFYHPKFSDNGRRIFFTSQNYKGLWYYNIHSGKVTQLSDANGIGYKFAVGKSGEKIYYRLKVRSGYKRKINYLIAGQNVSSKKINILVTSKGRISPPVISGKNTLLYFKEGKLHIIDLTTKTEKSTSDTADLILSLDNKLVKIKHGKLTRINIGNSSAVLYAAKSPVSDDIAYEVKGKGLFVKSSNGRTNQIKNGLQPAWSPDGRMLAYVKEKADGMKITGSKIFIAALPSLKEFNLLAGKNIVASNPAWSPDGKKIVFNSDDGGIILATLNIQ